MIAKTMRLFVKALIIGTLINLGLQQLSAAPLPANPTIHNQIPGQSIPLSNGVHPATPVNH